MQSIFGFYYVVGLLSHMGWPRRRGLFSSEAVVDSLILDSAIDQMIDWSANIGAEIENLKKQWTERGDSSNPREAVKPVKFSKNSKVISMKQLKHKDIQH